MKILKKILSISLCLAIIGMGTVMGIAQEQNLDIKWLDIKGSDVYFPSFFSIEDGCVVVYVRQFDETGKSGFVIVDLEKETVSKPLYYESVQIISEGLACVWNTEQILSQDGKELVWESKCGYVDTDGEIKIPMEYNSATGFSDGYAVVSKYIRKIGEVPGIDEVTEVYGLIDKEGNVVEDFTYSRLFYAGEGTYLAARPDGKGNIENGLLKTDGRFIPIDNPDLFVVGEHIVGYKPNMTLEYYNFDGQRIIAEIGKPGYLFVPVEGMLITYEGEKYGYYNLQEERITIAPKYDYADNFSEGLAAVGYFDYSYENGNSPWKLGYIDKTGKEVISPQYRMAGFFSEGIATVMKDRNEGDLYDSYGAIDKSGGVVLPLKYSQLSVCKEGIMFAREQGSDYGYMDKSGKKLTPYKYAWADDFIEGIAIVATQNAKGGYFSFGAINRFGNEIVLPEYLALTRFSDGKALIGKGDESVGTMNKIGILHRPETVDYNTGVTEIINVIVDGKPVIFDQDPLIISDRTMVPLRGIFEALGAEVTWNQEKQTAYGVKGDEEVSIQIGSQTGYVNGKGVTLDSPAILRGDRTLVPVRFIAESFQCEVDWDPDTMTVIISTGATTE